MLKKLALICALFCLFAALVSCGAPAADNRPVVVTTLYPQYDFCKNIAGDSVSLTLLLDPGVDAHSYDPTPADLLTLCSADLLIYTGADMELWLDKLLASSDVAGAVERGKLHLLDLSASVDLLPLDEDEDEDEHAGHEHGKFDPHIWTSPKNALKMCDAILTALCELDGVDAALCRANCAAYTEKLSALADDFDRLAETAAGGRLYFGGSFAFAYLCRDLSLSHRSLYDGCAAHTEPAPAALASLIGDMRAAGAPVILYDSPAEEKIAKKIAAETGAAVLRLHAIHNISKDELAGGEDYLSLMRRNLEVLGKALAQ
ncbi:MAG: zinc ABC transporter substrate-binding protein [Clostridia bacterium]|nr:zinc ABC transporter substrate-binding protein [Clostridia bacterium]